MIMNKPGALACAGVFCVAAASACGAAEAVEVYPGCPAPPTTFHHIWYVDPVNGKTQADGGDGSKARPWNSLNAIVSSTTQPGYTRPLLSSVPFAHRQPLPGTTQRVYADETGAVVQPGDEILLMDGQYGDISIGTYGVRTANPAYVTIAAAPGQNPVLSTLGISAASYFAFSGIKVQNVADNPRSGGRPLVGVSDQGPNLPSSNFVFTNMRIASADDTSGWTKADWVARAHVGGIYAKGGDHGADTTCVSVTNSHISNVIFGANVMANNMLFAGNEIERFGDDGIDYGASNILIARNYIHDDLDLGTGAHLDGMQGYPGVFTNVVIDSNRVIRQTDPNLQFPTYLQGIDAFDGDWTNLKVINNVVVTSACWGIGFGSVHGGKVINNTVVDDGSDTGTRNPLGHIMCRPGISVGDKSHEGTSSNDVMIRNNIATILAIDNLNPNMTMDHNVCVTIAGRCQILNFKNGKPNYGASKPGEYEDHNIVAAGDAVGQFVNFNPAKFAFDVRLRPGARAIGAGNPDEAPPLDITGAQRGHPVDAGAYRHDASP